MKPIRIYKIGMHFGEEPVVVGNDRSGMINFSGCHLSCTFCYTPETSVRREGTDYDPAQLPVLVDKLVADGAKNLNLISPTHVFRWIAPELGRVRAKYGNSLPLVLKVSGYESLAMANEFRIADVLVPDFKVFGAHLAHQVGLPADYGTKAQEFIAALMKTHVPQFGADGNLHRGILVRHLLMPGAFADSQEVVKRLSEIGYRGYVNFMTRFIDPKRRKLFTANSENVSELVETAQTAGMVALVDGKIRIGEVAHAG